MNNNAAFDITILMEDLKFNGGFPLCPADLVKEISHGLGERGFEVVEYPDPQDSSPSVIRIKQKRYPRVLGQDEWRHGA